MRSWRRSEAGWLARAYARVLVFLRWFVVLGWVVGAAAAAAWLPASSGQADLGGFAPPNSRAIETETASAKAFGFPVLSRTIIVQRDEHGLTEQAQQRVVQRAVAVAQGRMDAGPIAAVVPVVNVQDVFRSSERGTTALSFVFSKPGTSFAEEVDAAAAFSRTQVNQVDDHLVGVTGTVPAQVEQTRILYDHLLLLECATLAVVVGIVALKFRSLVAPVVALLTAALSYFLAVRVTNYVAGLSGIGAPEELKPLVLALILGIVTDYAIFFLSSMRTTLEQGSDPLTSARTATAQTGRIVLVAGIAVAAGCAAMLVAESGFLRAFGPVLSLSVLTSVVVSLTLLPALLAILGKRLFWPSRMRTHRSGWVARTAARVLTIKVVALVLGGACVVGLGVVASEAVRLRLGVSFAAALPADSGPQVAERAASAGFAPGIVAPTELLLRGDGVGADPARLSRLARTIDEQNGVAGVLSPSALPEQVVEGALVSRDRSAARFLIVLEHDPLGARAIEVLDDLSDTMPELLGDAGVGEVEWGFAGDTAVASELVSATNSDLRRIAVAVLLVNLLLLVVFLRALLAPVLLLGTSVLALGASLGALTWLFQDRLGHENVAFYVPFAASVLLLSLGSDYNIYGVGHVWTRAKHTSLRTAIAERVPETSGAITAAGITLAASFGMLALVPLRQFRELAFVMALGVLLDALVVRTVLVPALLALLGRFSAWPRRLGDPSTGPLADQEESLPGDRPAVVAPSR